HVRVVANRPAGLFADASKGGRTVCGGRAPVHRARIVECQANDYSSRLLLHRGKPSSHIALPPLGPDIVYVEQDAGMMEQAEADKRVAGRPSFDKRELEVSLDVLDFRVVQELRHKAAGGERLVLDVVDSCAGCQSSIEQ